MRPLKDILIDYQIDNDIFSEEEEITQKVKEIIWDDDKINEIDRRIIFMYADLASLRKLGAELSVSGSAIHKRIKEIRQKIYDNLLEPTTDNADNSIHSGPVRDNTDNKEMDMEEIH